MSQSLLPCPHCGNNKPYISEEEGVFRVVCGRCSTNDGSSLEAVAVRAWNNRKLPLISLADAMPPFDEGVRVLIYTAGHEFTGEQYFDVSADSLNQYNYEHKDDMPEICRHATHWFPL